MLSAPAGTRFFDGERRRTLDEFLGELESFREFGKRTEVEEHDGIPIFRNEFWTAKQRAGHSLHEISYRACFKPQLPAFFIRRLTEPGEVVFDPFMGRGTTLLEAALRGRDPLGNDGNPLSRLLIEPRLEPPSEAAVAARLERLRLDAPAEDPEEAPDGFEAEVPDDFEVFFEERTLRQISNLRRALAERRAGGREDAVDRWIRMVALNRLTGHSRGFFSVYTLPPNQAAGIERQRKINERRGQRPEYREVAALILRKTRSLLRDLPTRAPTGRVRGFFRQPVSDPFAYDGPPVALSVTSPPFLDIVDYRADNWMRCWFAGIEPDTAGITQTGKLEEWKELVRNALDRVAAISRPGSAFAFEVGEVRNRSLLLDRVVVEVARGTAWEPVCVLVNEQRFTKTSNTWGVRNNRAGTNTNRIVVLRLR